MHEVAAAAEGRDERRGRAEVAGHRDDTGRQVLGHAHQGADPVPATQQRGEHVRPDESRGAGEEHLARFGRRLRCGHLS